MKVFIESLALMIFFFMFFGSLFAWISLPFSVERLVFCAFGLSLGCTWLVFWLSNYLKRKRGGQSVG